MSPAEIRHDSTSLVNRNGLAYASCLGLLPLNLMVKILEAQRLMRLSH